jgi:hypothetical protein
MAGRQLRDMLTDLRAVIGHSTNVAHGINDRDTLLYYLNRTQVQLYQDYDWPQLMSYRTIPIVEGQSNYPFPVDLAFDDVTQMWANQDTRWSLLTYGIGPEQWSQIPATSQQWPLRWMYQPDDGTFELWPTPDATASNLVLYGTKTVTTMVDDSDLSTLPDNLIVLFSAVEILQRDDAKDAALKLNKANEAMRRHRVRQGSHKRVRAMAIGAGGGDAQARHQYPPAIGLDYVPPGYGSGPGS